MRCIFGDRFSLMGNQGSKRCAVLHVASGLVTEIGNQQTDALWSPFPITSSTRHADPMQIPGNIEGHMWGRTVFWEAICGSCAAAGSFPTVGMSDLRTQTQ